MGEPLRNEPGPAPAPAQAAGRHEYDGIREEDNRLPTWWRAILAATIVFAYGYWFYYHVLDATPGSADEYKVELAAAEEARAKAAAALVVDDEVLKKSASSPADVEAGALVYKQNCLACHGDRAQGLVGPNLTDRYWIHGGRPMQIFNTVAAGVLPKGMPAWESNIGKLKVVQVVSYTLTLRDKNVPGKAPEGRPEE